MDRHFTIHVNTFNDHAVLQRILLAFSRRRLRIRALHFFDLDAERPADMQIELDCRAEQARDLLAQIRAIVEVTQVWFEEAPASADTPAVGRLAAA
jgi:acetolactate synthase small subunit